MHNRNFFGWRWRRNGLAALLCVATGAAHAIISLDSEPDERPVVTISAETLLDNQVTTVDGENYYQIVTGSQDLLVIGQLGVRGATGRQVFVRFDLGNMVLRLGIDNDWATIPNVNPSGGSVTPAPLTLEHGGGQGQSFAIYSAAEGTEIFPNADVHVAAHNRLAVRNGLPGTLRMTVYYDLNDAIAQRNPLVTKGGTIVLIMPSLSDTVAAGEVTAMVDSGFTQLREGDDVLGTFTMAVGGGARTAVWDPRPAHLSAQGGTVVDALTEVVAATNGAVLTYTGDFSVGNFTSNTASPAACGGTNLTTRAADGTVMESITAPGALGTTSFCLAVPADNADEIPEGDYMVAAAYTGITNAAFPPMNMAETLIGSIGRDGTRVHIPYLTTYEGYNQRVIIVNRGDSPMAYTFSFVSEPVATATAGDAAMGTVPADSRVVLSVADIVTLEGRSRTAAVLDLVGTRDNINVATMQVNRTDSGTDTVLYEAIPSD